LAFELAVQQVKYGLCHVVGGLTTAAALLENNEASSKLTTANGGTFT